MIGCNNNSTNVLLPIASGPVSLDRYNLLCVVINEGRHFTVRRDRKRPVPTFVLEAQTEI